MGRQLEAFDLYMPLAMGTSVNRSAEVRGTSSPGQARTLRVILDCAHLAGAVLREDLSFGDRLTVRTRNSTYRLWSCGDGTFAVSGGWFDRERLSPAAVTINGCTHGGSVLHQDVVAAPGLFLEFGNRVATTRIVSVDVERALEPPSTS